MTHRKLYRVLQHNALLTELEQCPSNGNKLYYKIGIHVSVPRMKIIAKKYYVVPTAKERLFSRTFPGQNYHLPGRSMQNFKVINRDRCNKRIIFIQFNDPVLNFLWYILLLTLSSGFIQQLLFKL